MFTVEHCLEFLQCSDKELQYHLDKVVSGNHIL